MIIFGNVNKTKTNETQEKIKSDNMETSASKIYQQGCHLDAECPLYDCMLNEKAEAGQFKAVNDLFVVE